MNVQTGKDKERTTLIKQWTTRVKECRNSGQTVRAWCADNQICVQTFYRWERKVRLAEEVTVPTKNQRNIPEEKVQRFVEFVPDNCERERYPEGLIAEIRTASAEIKIFSGARAEEIRILCEVALC